MQKFTGILLLAFVLSRTHSIAAPPAPGLERVRHIIVIFLEYRSFDHLYGMFPGADGIGNSGIATSQVTVEGNRFDVFPAVPNNYSSSWIDPR